MNKLHLLFCYLFFSWTAMAQVGIGTSSPDAATVLDINSEISTGVYGGLKLPTVTLAQRATIATPIPDGLMIYVSDVTMRCVQIYDGNLSSWVDFYCMNNVPEALAVSITGMYEVEETLTGVYTYNDPDGDLEATSTYQWYRADDAAGTNVTAIPGATATTYTLTSADAGHYISYEVIPVAATGATTGLPVRTGYTLVNYKDVEVNFNQQNQALLENSVNDDVQLSFTLSNTSYVAITLTVTANDYTRLDETVAATIVIPANATSPYTTTVAPFNIDDNVAMDGTANITFTISAISGGSGNTNIGTTTTDTLQVLDDDSVPVLLAIQDFEVVPATPTLPIIVNTAGSYQTGTGTGTGNNQNTFIDGRSYGVNNSYADIDFGPVDASSYNSATLRLRLASFSVNSTGNGADGGDFIDIYISDDGGATFSYELEILGNSNRRFDFGATGSYSLIYDGDNVRTSVITPNLISGYTYIDITGLPAITDLVVGIVLSNDNINELWAIDNVEIYGNP